MKRPFFYSTDSKRQVKIAVAVVIVGLAAFLLIRVANEQKANKVRLSLSLTDRSTDIFLPKLTRGLPSMARKYLAHSVERGATLANRVELDLKGMVRRDEESKWLPFTATETLVRGRGFLWKAKIKNGRFMYVTGTDHYCDGTGEARFFSLGIVPEAHEYGPAVDLSFLGRAAIESVMLPTVFLPAMGARWEHLDGPYGVVTVPVGEFTSRLSMSFAENGALREATVQRYRAQDDGRIIRVPFVIKVMEERKFGGFTIPSKIRAGWMTGIGQFEEIYRAAVKEASFS